MSNQPITLLKEAIDAHGGRDRWRRFKGIASTIITGGRLWDIKGVNIIRTPRRATSSFAASGLGWRRSAIPIGA